MFSALTDTQKIEHISWKDHQWVTHGLRAIIFRFNINTVFSCWIRLKQLCQRVQNDQKSQGFTVKHVKKIFSCEEKKVYSIPLGCGGQQIGQKVRCVTHRLQEHHLEVSWVSAESYHLSSFMSARVMAAHHPLIKIKLREETREDTVDKSSNHSQLTLSKITFPRLHWFFLKLKLNYWRQNWLSCMFILHSFLPHSFYGY